MTRTYGDLQSHFGSLQFLKEFVSFLFFLFQACLAKQAILNSKKVWKSWKKKNISWIIILFRAHMNSLHSWTENPWQHETVCVYVNKAMHKSLLTECLSCFQGNHPAHAVQRSMWVCVNVCFCAYKVSVFLLAHVEDCRERGQVFGYEIHSNMQQLM